jgi:membrane-bound lytic murein transglycosylase F
VGYLSEKREKMSSGWPGGDYPAVMPDELDKEQQALPFFQFRAETQSITPD